MVKLGKPLAIMEATGEQSEGDKEDPTEGVWSTNDYDPHTFSWVLVRVFICNAGARGARNMSCEGAKNHRC